MGASLKQIHIASDHAGFDLKNIIIKNLQSLYPQIKITDHGPSDTNSVDYPDFANKVCLKLNNETLNNSANLETLGILVCGSGQGMALRANKFQYIRAALVYNDEIAKLAREHNNANIICLGSRFCGAEDAFKWVELFINTSFSEGRHALRVAKINQSTT